MVSAKSLLPGVSYWARGTRPIQISTSGRTQLGTSMPATAKAVACGGWAWATALISGSSWKISRCRRISLVRGLVPPIWLPSSSTTAMSSGARNPFETPVGVHR